MDWEAIPILSDIIRVVIVYSPRVVFAAIALALGWVIGRLVSFLTARFVEKIRLEPAFRRTSVGRAILRGGYTPSRFFAMLGKIIIYLFATFSALGLLSIPLLTDLVQAVIEYLPFMIEGILIIVIGVICVDWVGEAIEKGVVSYIFPPRLLAGLIRMILYFVVFTIALSEMMIDVTIFYIFAQAFAWSFVIIVCIAVGLNLKDKIGPWFDRIMERKERTEDER